MTSPSRRNRRITRPSTRHASSAAGVQPVGVPPSGGSSSGNGRIQELRLLRRSRGSQAASLILAIICCLHGGNFLAAADEPVDPISKLGQRSALQRWKDARSEWIGGGSARRERRQHNKHGAALDDTFEPDVSAPQVPLTSQTPAVAPLDPPGRVSLSPVLTDTETPRFIAPPRAEKPFSPPTAPVPLPDPPADTPVVIEVVIPVPPATDLDPPAAAPNPFPVAEERPVQDTPAVAGVLPSEPDLAPGEPTAVTAMLPQIPRPPVAPSPTPSTPPTRVPPAPPPRLPEESPSFIIPRSAPLVPPGPDAGRTPLAAMPVALPQLTKITEIQPFRSCSTDGKGVRLCPPNTAGEESDRCPDQHPLPVFDATDRNFIDIEYCWDAPNLFHTPLYFEDVTLERYGHTYCEPLQTVASATKFGVQFIGLPYQMALAPIHKREYPLGYYRPGDPAPHKCYQIPLNAEAAFKAAYVYTGMSFITP